MDIISRQQAQHTHTKRFYTAIPCKHGHVCERYVASGDCVLCSNAKSKQSNIKHGISRRYYKNNKEKHLQQTKQWRKDHLAQVCAYNQTEYSRIISRLNQAKRRALSKGIEFTLTREDIVIPTHCPILGIPLKVAAGLRNDHSPSIDRFDNNLGYTRENIRIISWRANRLKSDATVDELREVVRYMENNE